MFTSNNLMRSATFFQPIKGRDADGKRIIEEVERFTVPAGLKPLRGGESVMQARLTARSPAIVTVMADSRTRTVTSEWVLLISGRRYEAKEDPRESEDFSLLELLVEAVG
ncbi:phage head completion protein [Paracoccus onubensis]|uniref:Head-tail adaptor protein n=1 Tax=Paracoccus onubensis TaxID=1675788 RepID=A0A418T425_9RHOB|nr:head-tail adaptor protein [Paracoccus onubensis]RJE87963.1 head-tail adaptor protein [Paracoccus onubensis]